LHLKEKGVNRFAFYGLPESSGKRWATEREYAFRQLVAEEKYRGVVCDVWLGWPLPLTIIVTLVLGLLLGAWNGWWVAYRKVPSFIVTLAGMLAFRGNIDTPGRLIKNENARVE
jgi:ribose/xylose/arabinose/galactoside ABC-type transport system permease subunit